MTSCSHELGSLQVEGDALAIIRQGSKTNAPGGSQRLLASPRRFRKWNNERGCTGWPSMCGWRAGGWLFKVPFQEASVALHFVIQLLWTLLVPGMCSYITFISVRLDLGLFVAFVRFWSWLCPAACFVDCLIILCHFTSIRLDLAQYGVFGHGCSHPALGSV